LGINKEEERKLKSILEYLKDFLENPQSIQAVFSRKKRYEKGVYTLSVCRNFREFGQSSCREKF